MRHAPRGKNKSRRKAFTTAQELAVWCSRLEAYLEPLELYERYLWLLLIRKDHKAAKRHEQAILKVFASRANRDEPKRTPEYKAMVVKAYSMARKGNKATVLRQFGVSHAEITTWKTQVRLGRWNRKATRVAQRILADWQAPTPSETKAAVEDFASRLAAECQSESLSAKFQATRLQKPKYTAFKVLPQVPEDPPERLTFTPAFEIIE